MVWVMEIKLIIVIKYYIDIINELYVDYLCGLFVLC